LRTLIAVDHVDRGYRADNVLTMMVDPLGSRYPTPESLLQFFQQVESEIAALPGVRSIAWASSLPLQHTEDGLLPFDVVGAPQAPESQRPEADYQIASPSYFQTIALPVTAGRAFNDRDTRNSPRVCMVSEAFVRRYAQGQSPLGMRLSFQDPGSRAPATVREVVGVARQVKDRPDEIQSTVRIYVPMAQQNSDDMYVLVRPVSQDAATLAPSVRAAIARIDKEQLVSVREISTLGGIASEATSRHRFRAVLVAALAGLSLALAMVGVFGILAYSVQQRVREIGVRRALGATTGGLIGLILGSAGRLIGAGALIGLALAATFGHVMATMLFGVAPLVQ